MIIPSGGPNFDSGLTNNPKSTAAEVPNQVNPTDTPEETQPPPNTEEPTERPDVPRSFAPLLGTPPEEYDYEDRTVLPRGAGTVIEADFPDSSNPNELAFVTTCHQMFLDSPNLTTIADTLGRPPDIEYEGEGIGFIFSLEDVQKLIDADLIPPAFQVPYAGAQILDQVETPNSEKQLVPHGCMYDPSNGIDIATWRSPAGASLADAGYEPMPVANPPGNIIPTTSWTDSSDDCLQAGRPAHIETSNLGQYTSWPIVPSQLEDPKFRLGEITAADILYTSLLSFSVDTQAGPNSSGAGIACNPSGDYELYGVGFGPGYFEFADTLGQLLTEVDDSNATFTLFKATSMPFVRDLLERYDIHLH